MKYLLGLLLITGCAGPRQGIYNPPQRWIVSAPVVDVRSEPKTREANYEYDPLQETQLIQGEPVLIHERRGDWVRVECPLQQEYTHNNKWEGYPGWVEARFLIRDQAREMMVTPVAGTEEELRQKVLAAASRHIGERYLWGGRSLHDPSDSHQVTGVDCSGLVNTAFLSIGRLVPRDAHEQYMRASRRQPSQLLPGDLIFLAKTDRPDRIVHVGFYAGAGDMLEAPQSGEAVRRISLTARFGRTLNDLANGMEIGDRVIYFGTLFEDLQPEEP